MTFALALADDRFCRTCGLNKPAEEMCSAPSAGNICKLCTRARLQRWIDGNRERYNRKRWEHHLRKKYGITLEQYELMLAEQQGCCAICRLPMELAPRRLHVDHNHETGVARGILCYLCNTGLGVFKDNAVRLRAAADYIDRKDGASCVP